MKHKIITIMAVVVWGLCFFALPVQAKYGGGSGEPNYPYVIYTAEQMNAIGADSNDWDKCFKLMADIDLSGYTGTSFNIIVYFKGCFDGNNHTISKFSYTSTGINHIGLFGYVDDPNAEINDLGLIHANVHLGKGGRVGLLVGHLRDGTITNCYSEGYVSGDEYVGGLVGYNRSGKIINCYSTSSISGSALGGDHGCVGGLVGYNYGTITNCCATGTVSGNYSVGGMVGGNDGRITNCYSKDNVTGRYSVGGLVGGNGGTITNSFSTGSVSGNQYNVGGLVGTNYRCAITDCYSEGNVVGYGHIGGLVGWNYEGTITNCRSDGNVTGTEKVGGFVGYNYRGTITNSYSTSDISGNDDVGGLVGKSYRGEVNASFWDIETSGQSTSDGGTGLPTANMQMASTFINAGWDFVNVWWILEGVGYPRHLWEIPVLQAEPEMTLGTSNIISWGPVVGDVEYYAECAADANFTNIVYSTGWITETIYEFTDLELGKRYWYSVKARNAAGIESQWSNVESSLQCTLADAVDIELEPESLKNENLKDALLNKINVVLEMIDVGLYENALSKLQNDILQKTNGCAQMAAPDKNDWIITCEGQSKVYPLIIEAVEHVKGLME